MFDVAISRGRTARRMKLLGVAAGMFVSAAAALPAGSSDDAAATIRRQSQAFSDASATGNIAVLGRYLDDNVTFTNENGETGSKQDLLAVTGPRPSGVSQRLVQTDWHLQRYGPVAVTAFTDVSTLHFHGQIVRSKFRSTEVWIEKHDGWKMISSQTTALQDDPPAISLPAATLAEYVGTYTAGPGYAIRIAQTGNTLTASTNGAAPVALRAEVKDVFFTPGQPRVRRIFQRDARGTVIGFVSRREGHDITLKRA
jgi:ketosteroid isomerase-like protein